MKNVANDTSRRLIENKYRLSFRRWLLGRSGGGSAARYIGADLSTVRQYYRDRFIDGMNWNNYGELWEIDHVIPVRLFDMQQDDDLRLCFHYKNTFPLLVLDNAIKGAGNLPFAIRLLMRSDTCEVRDSLIAFAENRLSRLDKYFKISTLVEI